MNKILESTGLVLFCDDFRKTFDILKKLYKENGGLYILISITNGSLIDLKKNYYDFMVDNYNNDINIYSLETPKFDILELFHHGWLNNYALIGNINDSLLWIIALLLVKKNEAIIVFSNEPEKKWLNRYVKSISKSSDPNRFCLATLDCWEEIGQQFNFSIFSMLPDWDSDNNMLLISCDQRLLHKLMGKEFDTYNWKKLERGMFPIDR